MSVSLSDLRESVYRRLGDTSYLASEPTTEPAEAVAKLADVDREINAAIRRMVRESERRGGRPLSDSGTISVVSGTREYSLDSDLKDSGGTAKGNFRADLFIERTDLDEPVNVRWSMGGDFKVREFLRAGLINGSLITEEMTGADIALTGNVPYLYMLDDRTIGYVETPTESQTLTCYYRPMVVKLVAFNDTLSDIGLLKFRHWEHLIALRAAKVLMVDTAHPTYRMLINEYADEWRDFVSSIARERRVSIRRRQSMWSRR